LDPNFLVSFFDKSSVYNVQLNVLTGIIRRLAAWIAEKFLHDPIFAKSLRESRVKSFGEIMEYTVQRNALVQEWYEKVRV
jgi:hypothetical protein